ncbi:hypothetical protein Ac2012v2_004580 [Leucoagaricus gongylophorus]
MTTCHGSVTHTQLLKLTQLQCVYNTKVGFKLTAAQDSSMTLLRRTTIRLFIFICAIFGLSWTFGLSWELPEFGKDTAIMISSRAKLAAAFSSRKQSSVDEVYGLLHLVTAESDEYQHVLTNNVELDPTKRISLNDYAPGNEDLDWTAEMERLNKEFPVVVFSKTFCSYSKKAKNLLASYELQPQVKVIEVDLRDDSAALKVILTRLTQHSTFPNVLLHGKSLGGWDELRALHSSNSLTTVLAERRIVVQNGNIY